MLLFSFFTIILFQTTLYTGADGSSYYTPTYSTNNFSRYRRNTMRDYFLCNFLSAFITD